MRYVIWALVVVIFAGLGLWVWQYNEVFYDRKVELSVDITVPCDTQLNVPQSVCFGTLTAIMYYDAQSQPVREEAVLQLTGIEVAGHTCSVPMIRTHIALETELVRDRLVAESESGSGSYDSFRMSMLAHEDLQDIHTFTLECAGDEYAIQAPVFSPISAPLQEQWGFALTVDEETIAHYPNKGVTFTILETQR